MLNYDEHPITTIMLTAATATILTLAATMPFVTTVKRIGGSGRGCFANGDSALAYTDSNDMKMLECKVKSQQMRVGQNFVEKNVYKTRRAERVKTLYGKLWEDVNENLENGNKEFVVNLDETDENIVQVVYKMLREELKQDGYNSTFELVNERNFIDTTGESTSTSSSDVSTTTEDDKGTTARPNVTHLFSYRVTIS